MKSEFKQTPERVRQVFEAYSRVVRALPPNGPDHVMAVASAGALAWILGLEKYADDFERIVKELESWLRTDGKDLPAGEG